MAKGFFKPKDKSLKKPKKAKAKARPSGSIYNRQGDSAVG
jgi:hypothetical protein